MTYSSSDDSKAQRKSPTRSQKVSGRKLTEAKATKLLERFLYYGCGSKYLGWKFAEYEIEPDGREITIDSGGCRVWQFEREEPPTWWKRLPEGARHRLDYLQPLHFHLKSCFRGLVTDDTTTHVPFLAIDPDRHTGTPTEDFIAFVEVVADIFEAETSDFRTSAEVNPNNGSAKLFAWAKNRRPIEIEAAREIAERIHNRVLTETGKSVEVFPFNMPNLRLPLHPEKITLIGSGKLGRAIRLKGREREKYETHSVLEFVCWLLNGDNYDLTTLLDVVRESCANLPDEPVSVESVHSEFEPESSKAEDVTNPRRSRSARPAAGSGQRPEHGVTASPVSIQKLQNESNSWIRQRDALLIACRKAKKVLSVEEALDFIHEHRLYTGDWSENGQRRRCRVEDILTIIAQTFDPKLCSAGKTFEIDVAKYRNFVAQWFPERIRRVSRKGYLRDTGEIRRYRRYVIATREDIACWMAINEFCRNSSEYGDGGVPEERAEEIWIALHRTGQITHKWCVKRWRLIRDTLHQRQIVVCDYQSETGKAYCYEPGQFHPGIKPRRKESSGSGTSRTITETRKTTVPNTEGVYFTRQNRLPTRNSALIEFRLAERGPP